MQDVGLEKVERYLDMAALALEEDKKNACFSYLSYAIYALRESFQEDIYRWNALNPLEILDDIRWYNPNGTVGQSAILKTAWTRHKEAADAPTTT